MTLAGIITMILSIGGAWALLLVCSAKLLRGEEEGRKKEASPASGSDGRE